MWRFDPILLTSVTDAGWHRDTFRRLCAAAQGTTTEVVVSTVQWYRKTARNVRQAAMAHDFSVEDPSLPVRQALLADLAAIAADHGLIFSVCAQPDRVPALGQPARCVDTERLSRVAGHPVAGSLHGNRPGCFCAQSVDIGAYDTCPHGCVYCYAVQEPERARANRRAHDPEGAFLIPPAGAYTLAESPSPSPALAQLRFWARRRTGLPFPSCQSQLPLIPSAQPAAQSFIASPSATPSPCCPRRNFA